MEATIEDTTAPLNGIPEEDVAPVENDIVSGGGSKRVVRHKSIDYSRLRKKDIGLMLMRKGGIMEDLKAFALTKGIKTYDRKEDLIEAILRKTQLPELQALVKAKAPK